MAGWSGETRARGPSTAQARRVRALLCAGSDRAARRISQLLGPDDDERARESYRDNLDRLLAAKRRYDPDNVFASAVPALLA
jgi:hypothetical protein